MSQTYGGAWWPLEAEMLVVDGEVVGVFHFVPDPSLSQANLG